MTPDRWKRVSELFHGALEREPQARPAFLAEACGGDSDLRGQVESLLAADERAGVFIAVPALGLAAGQEEAATLERGRRLGPYEIVDVLGQGGMGCVYRARDGRLGRDVAVKVLSRSFAGEGPRLARFRNEARAVSALNHPNIVTVHDVGEEGGVPFYAMELVAGRTLRQIMKERPLPLRTALALAAQVAEGLAAAHARGIVHRDLKPENVMVTPDGLAKVVDFGLAKPPLEPEGHGTASLMTQPGAVLGTVGYMSPEQASGRAVDFRSDVFSLGSLLYETVAHRRAFERPTPVETLAAIIREEPLPLDPALPLPLRWVIERCLAKDPAERYAATLDLARDLKRLRDALPQLGPHAAAPRAEGRLRTVLPWAAALGLVAALAGLGLSWRGRPGEPPVLRHLTYTGTDSSPALSPDGQVVAFASRRDGRSRIWLKQVATGAEAALTEGPDDQPRFAPSGASILFTRTEPAGPALYQVPALGGEPQRLLSDARSGDWSPDGRRLAFVRFARAADDRPRYFVGVAGADGATPRVVETIEATTITAPRWSPDSRRLALSHAPGAGLEWSILVLDADGGTRLVLRPPERFGAVSLPVWTAGGRALLYTQSDSVEGSPSGRLVLHPVGSRQARSLLSALHLGVTGLDARGGRAVLTLQPLRGNLREVPLRGGPSRWLTRGNSDDRQACYSSDGERVVFSSNRDGQLDLWEVALGSGAVRRLTRHPAEDWDPRVARDGRLLWSSKRSGSFEIWMAEPDGTAPRQLTREMEAQNPDITPDGQWVVFTSGHAARRGIWKIRPDGSGAVQLAAGNLGLPEISPDGRLVLYAVFNPPTTSLRVARLADGAPVPFEVQMPSGLRTDISFIRGRARWLPDGRAVAYVDLDEQGRAGIALRAFHGGPARPPRPLLGFEPDVITESFGFAPDGSRVTVTFKQRSSDLVLAEGLDLRP